MTDQAKPEVGDWIRFRGRRFVIGEVLYRKERTYAPWLTYSITEQGSCDDPDVLEIRRKQK